jgi:hypothetical protein
MNTQAREDSSALTPDNSAAELGGHEPSRQLVNGLNSDERALLARLDAALADGAALGIRASQYSTLSGLECMQLDRIFLTGVSSYQLEHRGRGPA